MKKIRLIGGALLFLILISSASFAVLTVNFTGSAPLQIRQISYYWNGDNTAANQQGRRINSDPTVASVAPYFVLSNLDRQACVGTPAPTLQYVFGADGAYPGSLNLSIRVWDSVDRGVGDHYTGLISSANSATAPGTITPLISYVYVRAVPAQPRISSIVVATTTNLLATPSPTTTGSTTFSSIQPAASAPNMIEAGSAQWRYKRNGGDWVTAAGENLTLTGDLIAHPGDRYEIQVMRTNVWGPGPWSDSYNYTVGAAPVGVTPPGGSGEAGVAPITYNLIHPTGLLGINPIAVQYNALTSPVTGNQVKNVVEAINTAAAGRNQVTAIGWWDITNQRPAGYAITYPAGAPTYLPIGGAAPSGNQALSDVPNGIYQVSLQNVTTGTGEVITFTGTR